MALLGQIHQEPYQRTRRKKSRYDYRLPERQRITTVEKWIKGKYQQILSAQYVEGTRKASRLHLFSGEQLVIIELQKDGTYMSTRLLPTLTRRKVIGLQFNQRTGTLTWHEINVDATVGPQQKCSIEEPLLTTAGLLLFFPIGWFFIPFQAQLKSIAKSWGSILDSAQDAYSER